MRRLPIALLAVALLAALVASCGSGEVTNEQYGRELRGAMDDLEAAYGDAGAAATPSANAKAPDVKETVRRLEVAQIALRDAGNKLDAIEAPPKLEKDHARLVRGVRDMADAVSLLIEAQQVAESDPARARTLAREFATDESFGTVEAAAAKLQEAGVDAGL